MSDSVPADVLDAYAFAAPITVNRHSGGLINRTFIVKGAGGEKTVLQAVNAIFSPAIHDDIEAVTAHLAARGLATPRLVRTRTGALFVQGGAGAIWRALTYVEGKSYHRVESGALAEEAGALVGRFHAALADFPGELASARLGVHDTDRHFQTLRTALAAHPKHTSYAEVARLAAELEAAYAELPKISSADLPLRVVHGDLKISNVMYDDAGRGLCLVDLDTLARMKLPLELGDAWRSWCNPVGEDARETRFDLTLFQRAWRGYARTADALLSREERELLVVGMLTVTVELSARFAADALNESYFGWDAARFATRGAHNLVRAQGQASLYRSLASQRGSAESIVASDAR